MGEGSGLYGGLKPSDCDPSIQTYPFSKLTAAPAAII